MTPAFTSWAAFFAMGHYGFYVWLAAAATILSLLGLWLHTRWQHQQCLMDIQRRQAREQRIYQSQGNQSQGNQSQRNQSQRNNLDPHQADNPSLEAMHRTLQEKQS